MGVSALVLTVLLYFVQPSQTCFLKPQVAEGPSPTPKQVLSGQIILPDYNFTCSGVISSWEARTTGRILSSIRFQVWRLVPGRNTYHLVGENVISPPQGVDTKGLQLSVANPSKQIHVSPGDFIGIFVDTERGNVKIQYKDSQETLAYVADVKVPLISFAKPLIMGPAFRSVMAAPEISVNVEGILYNCGVRYSTNLSYLHLLQLYLAIIVHPMQAQNQLLLRIARPLHPLLQHRYQ